MCLLSARCGEPSCLVDGVVEAVVPRENDVTHMKADSHLQLLGIASISANEHPILDNRPPITGWLLDLNPGAQPRLSAARYTLQDSLEVGRLVVHA